MDKRALKILFDAYRFTDGWRERPRQIALEDFAYAKAAGVMFDPVKLNHDQVLQRLIEARDALKPRQVADALLASLSTRRLELRSALGSFVVFRHLAPHQPSIAWSSVYGLDKPRRCSKRCDICGQYLSWGKKDLNELNFGRLQWGGVSHDDPLYGMLDLELFAREEPVRPTPDDIGIFRNLIEATEAAPVTTTSATLQRLWTGTFKSNKGERDAIVAILGFCGILETAEHQGYRNRFIAENERDLPNRHHVDMDYPACWWSAKDGINKAALQDWFGHVL